MCFLTLIAGVNAGEDVLLIHVGQLQRKYLHKIQLLPLIILMLNCLLKYLFLCLFDLSVAKSVFLRPAAPIMNTLPTLVSIKQSFLGLSRYKIDPFDQLPLPYLLLLTFKIPPN